jgi:hypothetical protein
MPQSISKRDSQQAAAVQMRSGSSVSDNLRTVDRLLAGSLPATVRSPWIPRSAGWGLTICYDGAVDAGHVT